MIQNTSTKLGVNIDHVATLRQARGTDYPSPLEAARVSVEAGADQITVHLREDRRHIQDDDVVQLKSASLAPLNLEMAATNEMIGIAAGLRPDRVTLVPEKRRELTTEGGLDLRQKTQHLKDAVAELRRAEIPVSLFIDPDAEQIRLALDMKVDAIELQTGSFADAIDPQQRAHERERLLLAAREASQRGLFVAAGHGLHLANIGDIATIQEIREFNIGHSIIARAVIVGIAEAVREMKAAIHDSSLHR